MQFPRTQGFGSSAAGRGVGLRRPRPAHAGTPISRRNSRRGGIMRRFAVLLAVSLSAGFAFAQEPADDRTPIPAGIDTWYRVDHNRVHVGWFHEELVTSTMRNYRYAYRVQSEYAYTTQNLAGEEVTYQIS